jgi:hypothetical protein
VPHHDTAIAKFRAGSCEKKCQSACGAAIMHLSSRAHIARFGGTLIATAGASFIRTRFVKNATDNRISKKVTLNTVCNCSMTMKCKEAVFDYMHICKTTLTVLLSPVSQSGAQSDESEVERDKFSVQ